jgi:predicted ATP-grasp superfamily ATP-dependent carboligase
MKVSYSNSEKPIAFVLGKYITTGLGIVRSLGKMNIPVVWIDSNMNQIGFTSKYCKGLVCPSSRYESKKYIDFLINIGKKLNQKGVLFPIDDISLFLILKYKSELTKHFNFTITDLKITEKLLNKKLFFKILEEFKIDHPKTIFTDDSNKIEKIIDKIQYPCILKPIYSAPFFQDFNKKLFQVTSKEDLIKNFNLAKSKNHNVIIQEIIPGEANNMYGFNAYFDETIRPIGSFIYKRIREWPHKFGNGCYIEKVDNDEIEKIIIPLIKKIKYNGIIDAELKFDPRDKKFKLIEINPRCWMQVSFPTRYGINIPFIAYMDTLGKKQQEIKKQNEEIKYLHFYEDFNSALKSIKQGKLTYREWLKSYKSKKEHSIFSWDDPLPNFVCMVKLCFTFKLFSNWN